MIRPLSAPSAAPFDGGRPRSAVAIHARRFVLSTLVVIIKGMIIVGAVAFDMQRSRSTIMHRSA